MEDRNTKLPAKVVVTGATGFLGSHVVRRLVADGVEVHALVRDGISSARRSDLAGPVVRWSGELGDRPSLVRCIRGARPDVIIHLAGNTAARHMPGDWSGVDRSIVDNFLGTLNVLRAAGESGVDIRAVIRTGGLEEYGNGETPYLETQREQPRSPYSASQVAATHWCQMLQPELPFAVTTLRPALIYGPGQSVDFLIPALITGLLRGERFPLTDGAQRRDLLFVDDFVDAMVLATGTPLRGAVINVSTNREQLIREVAIRIATMLGAESQLDVGALPTRPGELRHLVGANDEARRLLGWQPTTDLDDGLRRTIDWYRARHPA